MAVTSKRLDDLRDRAGLLPAELVGFLESASVEDADFASSALKALEFALERTVDTAVSILAAEKVGLAELSQPQRDAALGTWVNLLKSLETVLPGLDEFGTPARDLLVLGIPLAPADAPAAFEVRRIVERLRKSLGKMETWTEDGKSSRLRPEIERLVAEVGPASPKPALLSDLLEPLTSIRNRWSHKPTGSGESWTGEFGETHLKPLLDLARTAAFELLVVDPLATLLQRWVPATVEEVRSPKKGQHEIDLRYQRGRDRYRLVFVTEDTEKFGKDEKWLIDTGASLGDGHVADPSVVCPFASALDLLRSRAGAVVEVDAVGSARLMAGVAAGREREGRIELLCLPTSLAVTVSLQPDRNGAGALTANSSRWEEGTRCAKTGAQHVANALEAGSLLVGEISVAPTEAPFLDGLHGATAAAVAAARAVSSGLGTAASPRLGNELQVEATAAATGSPQPWRDLFGWVDSESGELIGGQLPCPSMDVLLVVPIRGGHRTRSVQVRRLFQADNPQCLPCQPQEGKSAIAGRDRNGTHLDRVALLEDLAPSEVQQADDRGHDARNEKLRQVIGALCTDVANALNGVEPNPNLALLQPLCEQFDALGLLASPYTWTAGLLFAPDAPGLAPAQEWLKSLRLPNTVDVVKTSTHATT